MSISVPAGTRVKVLAGSPEVHTHASAKYVPPSKAVVPSPAGTGVTVTDPVAADRIASRDVVPTMAPSCVTTSTPLSNLPGDEIVRFAVIVPDNVLVGIESVGALNVVAVVVTLAGTVTVLPNVPSPNKAPSAATLYAPAPSTGVTADSVSVELELNVPTATLPAGNV